MHLNNYEIVYSQLILFHSHWISVSMLFYCVGHRHFYEIFQFTFFFSIKVYMYVFLCHDLLFVLKLSSIVIIKRSKKSNTTKTHRWLNNTSCWNIIFFFLFISFSFESFSILKVKVIKTLMNLLVFLCL